MAPSKFVLIYINYDVASKCGNATSNNNTDSEQAQLEQLRDATAGLVGCTELLSGNGSWYKHTLGRA